MDIIPHWLTRLEQVKKTSKGYEARCPSHRDVNPSLSIDPGAKGWLLYCHRGCSTREVMGSIGLGMNELYYDNDNTEPVDTTQMDADEFFKKAPWKPCIRLHTFNEIALAALPFPVDTAWAEASVFIFPYGTDRFDRTMGMWPIWKDGWLNAWAGTLWLDKAGPKKDWKEVGEWAAQTMWEMWITQGCSTCPLEASPRPVLGLG